VVQTPAQEIRYVAVKGCGRSFGARRLLYSDCQPPLARLSATNPTPERRTSGLPVIQDQTEKYLKSGW
jgi:hypothetical protein